MARQGYRVWAARLIIGMAIFFVVVGIAGTIVWRRLTRDAGTPVATNRSVPNNAQPTEQSAVPHALDPVLQLARSALKQHQSRDRDYTATLVKHERIAGKLGPITKMELKLRYNDQTDPRSVAVYMKFIEPKAQSGRELIWIQGQNDNRLTVHEAGFLNLTRIPLSPTSTLAMLGNRYPITEIGIEMLIKKLIEKGERDRELGPCDVTLEEGVSFLGRKCKRIEVTHQEPTVMIGEQNVAHEFYKAIIYIDEELMLPIQYSSYSWPKQTGEAPVLEEEYTYENLKLNVDLTDNDFDPDNSSYNFPK